MHGSLWAVHFLFKGKCVAFWLIGQKVLVKIAITVVKQTVMTILSFLKEDTGWTKNVGKIFVNT